MPFCRVPHFVGKTFLRTKLVRQHLAFFPAQRSTSQPWNEEGYRGINKIELASHFYNLLHIYIYHYRMEG